MIRSRTTAWAVLGALTAGLLLATAALPYLFPPSAFVVGASYEVGFNNTVSFLGYVLLVPLLAIIVARLLPPLACAEAVQWRWQVSRQSHLVAVAVIAGHVALFAGLYAYKGRFVFAESLYFQSLLYRMSGGEFPFTDFSFYYGPLMLYPAHWLTGLVGLDAAYGVWFITTYLVGLVFLYVVVGFTTRNPRATSLWFAFLSLGLFNPLTGLNVTFTRYLFPSIICLAATRFLRGGGWAQGALAAVLLGAALTYSFEVAALSVGIVGLLAVVFAASHDVSGAVTHVARRVLSLPLEDPKPPTEAPTAASITLARVFALLTIATCLAVVVFLVTDPSGRSLREYPKIAVSYSGGAHNVPIYPHLPFLTLSAVTVAAFAVAIRAAAHGQLPSVLAAYAILTLVSQRASFAAAEPSHFAYFGLPVFLLAVIAAGLFARTPVGEAALAAFLLIGIALPMQYYHLSEFVPFLEQRLFSVPGNTASLDAPTSVPPSREAVTQELRALVGKIGSARPYVMYEMDYDCLPVYRDFGLRYALYSTMLINARDHDGIRRAIDEVRSRNAVVVIRRQDLDGTEQPRRSQGVARLLDWLSGAHSGGSDLSAVLLQSKMRLMAPFLEFVRTEFVPLYEGPALVAYGAR